MKPLSFLLYRSVADPRRRQEEAITLLRGERVVRTRPVGLKHPMRMRSPSIGRRSRPFPSNSAWETQLCLKRALQFRLLVDQPSLTRPVTTRRANHQKSVQPPLQKYFA